ncbi:MAG: hypothetical protein ACOX6T_07965 [Myxococcales bacterium]
MISAEIQLLTTTAASIGFFHTLAGPDHYLPFVMMSRARGWGIARTTAITVACGVGHVLGSIALGFAGVLLGTALVKLELIESVRGDLAAWALLVFGVGYTAWGIHRAVRGRVHSQAHGEEHDHGKERKPITPWVLFVIFVLGPCEPLIPILMYPAAKESVAGLVLVATVFGVLTVATMIGAVVLATCGVRLLPLGQLEHYSHAMAGGAIALCACAILFLGL